MELSQCPWWGGELRSHEVAEICKSGDKGQYMVRFSQKGHILHVCQGLKIADRSNIKSVAIRFNKATGVPSWTIQNTPQFQSLPELIKYVLDHGAKGNKLTTPLPNVNKSYIPPEEDEATYENLPSQKLSSSPDTTGEKSRGHRTMYALPPEEEDDIYENSTAARHATSMSTSNGDRPEPNRASFKSNNDRLGRSGNGSIRNNLHPHPSSQVPPPEVEEDTYEDVDAPHYTSASITVGDRGQQPPTPSFQGSHLPPEDEEATYEVIDDSIRSMLPQQEKEEEEDLYESIEDHIAGIGKQSSDVPLPAISSPQQSTPSVSSLPPEESNATYENFSPTGLGYPSSISNEETQSTKTSPQSEEAEIPVFVEESTYDVMPTRNDAPTRKSPATLPEEVHETYENWSSVSGQKGLDEPATPPQEDAKSLEIPKESYENWSPSSGSKSPQVDVPELVCEVESQASNLPPKLLSRRGSVILEGSSMDSVIDAPPGRPPRHLSMDVSTETTVDSSPPKQDLKPTNIISEADSALAEQLRVMQEENRRLKQQVLAAQSQGVPVTSVALPPPPPGSAPTIETLTDFAPDNKKPVAVGPMAGMLAEITGGKSLKSTGGPRPQSARPPELENAFQSELKKKLSSRSSSNKNDQEAAGRAVKFEMKRPAPGKVAKIGNVQLTGKSPKPIDSSAALSSVKSLTAPWRAGEEDYDVSAGNVVEPVNLASSPPPPVVPPPPPEDDGDDVDDLEFLLASGGIYGQVDATADGMVVTSEIEVPNLQPSTGVVEPSESAYDSMPSNKAKESAYNSVPNHTTGEWNDKISTPESAYDSMPSTIGISSESAYDGMPSIAAPAAATDQEVILEKSLYDSHSPDPIMKPSSEYDGMPSLVPEVLIPPSSEYEGMVDIPEADSILAKPESAYYDEPEGTETTLNQGVPAPSSAYDDAPKLASQPGSETNKTEYEDALVVIEASSEYEGAPEDQVQKLDPIDGYTGISKLEEFGRYTPQDKLRKMSPYQNMAKDEKKTPQAPYDLYEPKKPSKNGQSNNVENYQLFNGGEPEHPEKPQQAPYDVYEPKEKGQSEFQQGDYDCIEQPRLKDDNTAVPQWRQAIADPPSIPAKDSKPSTPSDNGSGPPPLVPDTAKSNDTPSWQPGEDYDVTANVGPSRPLSDKSPKGGVKGGGIAGSIKGGIKGGASIKAKKERSKSFLKQRTATLSMQTVLQGKISITQVKNEKDKSKAQKLYGSFQVSKGFPEQGKLEFYDKPNSKSMPKAVVRVKNILEINLKSGKKAESIEIKDTSSGGSKFELTAADKSVKIRDWHQIIYKEWAALPGEEEEED